MLSNLNSRRVESGAETWANSLAGTSFSHKVRFTNASPAKSWTSGQIYTWSACTPPTVSVSPSPASYCPGGSVALTASGATSYAWSPASGLSGTTGANVTANPSALTVYTVSGTSTGCAFAGTQQVTVAIKGAPTAASATPSATSACTGGTINLTGSATNLPGTLLSNNFNSGLNGWSTVNSSTGGTPADAAWTLRPNGYFYNASSGSDPTFNSNDNTQFLLSNSDDQGSGGTTATILQSPGFNTEGYTAVSLTYFHYFRFNSGPDDRARVEVSTDNQNWTILQTHSTTQGTATGFVSTSVNLNAYVGEEVVYVRFRYSASNDWWWAIDNVTVTGTPAALTWGWTSTPAGFTSSSQSPSGVAVSQTRVYNLTATAGSGCTATASTASVTAVPPPNAGTNGSLSVCATSTTASLLTALGGSPDATGSWSGPSTVIGNNYNATTMTPGVYTYTVTPTSPCVGNATATVTVTEQAAPNAGTNGSLSVCATSTTASLLTALGGSPDATGSWSGPSTVIGNNYDATTMTPGVYTYTVTPTSPCVGNATATVTVTEQAVPNAGTNGSLTICSNDPSAALVASLGGTPDGGGAWTGPSAGIGGSYDPATMAPGVYTYTVSAAPCADASATVTVTENTATLWYADTDGDGFGDPGSSQLACTAPLNHVANSTDNCPSVFGVIGSSCNDGNACTLGDVLNASCTCAGTYTDTDSDGVCDANDNCPTVSGQIGSACDDGVDCTVNDVLDGLCNCAGTFTDTDSDGTCDFDDGCPLDPNKTWEGICGCGNPDVDGDGDTVMDCLDGCPTDPNKISPGLCGCGTPDTDTDGDAAADCNDLCPLDPNKTAPGTCGCGNAEPGTACNDGNPNTGNDVVNASCQCIGTTLDCAGVPGGPAIPGTACDDSNPGTVNDVYLANCTCAGTPTGQIVGLMLNTDANGSQTSWEIIPLGGGAALCSGSNYASNSSIPLNCPLADGCYVLRVMDSFGDGMTTGGYMLHDGQNKRIIDNDGDGNFTFTSELANGQGFCLPLGTDRVKPSRCDLESLLPTDWTAAEENPAVSAQFGIGNQADDGYQFWFFNPDGGYSRRTLITHATNNYLFPWGPARCSYLRLSDLVTLPLPHNTLLNLRVRSLVNGVYGEFGPACRLKIDLVNQCPTTQLVDDTNSPNHSCGLTNVLLNGSQYLHAVYVANVVKYQFEFDDINSTYLRRIAIPGSSLHLVPWATLPLQYGTTYSVRVRVSYDNGANYCPWGNACTITTAPTPPSQSQGRGMVALISAESHEFRLWPNPNRGDVLNLIADGLSEEAVTAEVVIMDLFGKQVHAAQVPVTDGAVREIMSLDGRLPSGVYLVTLQTQGTQQVQRLVVE
ncbi:MAG: T9SS type A sorting domain-containing protein [Flavobacteriales bacterium]|nr:T9SS type A sorting domain-containing protein [Flavobacteriales bacterium]